MRLKAVPRWLGDIALVLVGAVIGAAVYHAMHLHQFNELMMMNIDLQDRLAHYKAEAEDLLRYKNRRTIIKSIEVHIYEPATGTALPQAHETEIRRRLLKDLSGLKGRDVFQIDEHSKLVEASWPTRYIPMCKRRTTPYCCGRCLSPRASFTCGSMSNFIFRRRCPKYWDEADSVIH